MRVPRVIAVDGEHVYVQNAKGFARIEIPSGHSELLRAGADNDSEQIFDTQTGDEVALKTSEYGFQTVSQWIDNDTVAVGVLNDPDAADPEVSMLTCEMPSGECEVVVEDVPANIVLPIGGEPRP